MAIYTDSIPSYPYHTVIHNLSALCSAKLLLFFLSNCSGMDGYNLDPLAQDSATVGHSLAVKGGVGGGVLFLLLAVIIYVFIKSRKCSMKCELQVDGASSRSVEEA
ncbi:hypothetical protein SADUNF_Sadunf15G0019100 [Salix dunnii]|uniref:Uncharacterized protein n=1 Tax=Salix dunnii TaxID=1413687 RepID=A0A835MIS1_9ROSI|nr:hypothetical protein SADUNF_Sadunf15G0019100 [Salix dunnii]